MSNTNLTKEEIIAAWKDPQVREKFANSPVHPSGKSFGDLTEEELAQIQGAADVKPETTPLCVGVIIGLTTSIKIC
ncbi:mersacidin/lichenicidin family type 2 lantibiotic [Metabacillus crassostreae]|uniref:mersacidin family lantibiotic n=1 Tax=Metabacillus crassostreae TaxID=929098 RepID=UPI00195E8500|nr:mersacidin family lantibiotic [Metabacillus crassostreae]MBM7606625.1 mersacidin/lichenicidin family type 2 lantibiotic [Metabacillus crassostreae]MBM7606626.1 mersacidin/lichenicidin family type 2 lantibiotic [Metabacillus crassostreae]MBM7606627.1 mersacidin/lichenicidin family type 2 lantibiotic [Metabacillus crassostreae]MBM7606628.1 mersacidin/lichenicidin family type 2 lantibiotic [Metabacillus crassostreae]